MPSHYSAASTTPTFIGSAGTAISVTNNNIWSIWVEQSISATNTCIWTNWAQQASATTASATSLVWYAEQAHNLARARRPTPEQVQQQLRQQEQYRQDAIRVEGEKAKARQRAELLLREHLDDRQKAVLAEKGYFELTVLSKDGASKTYRIHRKWSGNIEQLDAAGRKLKTLCIHPRIATPVEDSMLAQKLMLESGMEEELLRIANHL